MLEIFKNSLADFRKVRFASVQNTPRHACVNPHGPAFCIWRGVQMEPGTDEMVTAVSLCVMVTDGSIQRLPT